MQKKNNKKGFTLAELLIVVAIIAVLVAIAIPIFTTQLEKSREATDLSNVRSAYAELVTTYLTDPGENKLVVPAKQKQAGWQSADGASSTFIGTDISGASAGSVKVMAHTDSYTLSINADGVVQDID